MAQHTDSSNSILLPSVALGASFFFLDTVRHYRRDDWLHTDFLQWGGLLAGLLLYVFCIGLLAGVASIPLGALFKNSRTEVAPLGLAGACLIILFAFVTEARASFIPILCATLTLFIFFYLVAELRLARNRSALYLAYSGACLIGTLALECASRGFLLHPQRTFIALAFASGVLVCTMLAAVALAKSRRRVTTILLTATVVALGPIALPALLRSAADTKANSEQPSLLLIVVDTLRADFCSVYGGAFATPTFEDLASEGTLFRRSYSMAPWTIPSMYGMFASNFQPGHDPKATLEERTKAMALYKFPEDIPTLAELLREKGYATGAVVANTVIPGPGGIYRGFNFRHAAENWWTGNMVRKGMFARLPFLHESFGRFAPSLAPRDRIDTSFMVTRYARAFLEQNNDKPFFLWAHYYDPHAPYAPPASYRRDISDWPHTAASGKTDDPKFSAPLPDEQAYYIGLYGAEIRYVDASVRTLLDTLASRETDDTYVALTSDHGEEFWDHGAVGHGQSLYQELIRVPLILRGPKAKAQEIDFPVSGLDLMPTLATFMKVKPPDQWRGRDLSTVVAGETMTTHDAPLFAQNTWARSAQDPLQTVIDGDTKLIRTTAGDAHWLYDVAADPHERNDLAPESVATVEGLNAQVDTWSGTFRSLMDADAMTGFTEEEIEERLEELRAIGYID
jgi:arylsulfatase A-like enzyme